MRISILALSFTGALMSSPLWAADHEIKLLEDMYLPETLTIEVGDTVHWVNTTSLPHSVTLNATIDGDMSAKPEGAETFNSGMIDPMGSFSRTFEVPGFYQYFCLAHGKYGMKGSINVVAASP